MSRGSKRSNLSEKMDEVRRMESDMGLDIVPYNAAGGTTPLHIILKKNITVKDLAQMSPMSGASGGAAIVSPENVDLQRYRDFINDETTIREVLSYVLAVHQAIQVCFLQVKGFVTVRPNLNTSYEFYEEYLYFMNEIATFDKINGVFKVDVGRIGEFLINTCVSGLRLYDILGAILPNKHKGDPAMNIFHYRCKQYFPNFRKIYDHCFFGKDYDISSIEDEDVMQDILEDAYAAKLADSISGKKTTNALAKMKELYGIKKDAVFRKKDRGMDDSEFLKTVKGQVF